MARKHEAVNLLLSGFSPGQIAEKMGVALSTVIGYVVNQIHKLERHSGNC